MYVTYMYVSLGHDSSFRNFTKNRESAPLSILKSLQVAQVGFNRYDLFLLKSCNIAR